MLTATRLHAKRHRRELRRRELRPKRRRELLERQRHYNDGRWLPNFSRLFG